MLLGHATQTPQGRLQPPGERHEALPTLHHHRMAPARVGQRELVDPVGEGDLGNDHPEFVADGEVRQAHAPGRVFLRKVDLALGAIHGTPAPHSLAHHSLLPSRQQLRIWWVSFW